MQLLSDIHRHWLEFLFAMTEKEIKARYKHAVLGFLWIVLNPLLQMVVLGFIFQFFVPVQVDNYFLFLFVGLLPWNFFSLSVTKSTPSIVYERALIHKAKFPRESIVLSIVLSNFFHFLASLSLLLILLSSINLLSGSLHLTQLTHLLFNWLGLIPLLCWILILTAGLSLLTAALNVKYRDVNFIVQAMMPLWFYATPVIYSLELLPQQLQFLFYLNPMTGIIQAFQYLLLNVPILNPSQFLLSLLTSVITAGLGWYIFTKESSFFDDWI